MGGTFIRPDGEVELAIPKAYLELQRRGAAAAHDVPVALACRQQELLHVGLTPSLPQLRLRHTLAPSENAEGGVSNRRVSSHEIVWLPATAVFKVPSVCAEGAPHIGAQLTVSPLLNDYF